MSPDGPLKLPSAAIRLLGSLGGKDPGKAIQRELGVDGHGSLAQEYHRVDGLAIAEGALHAVASLGNRLLQQPFQEHLTDHAAELGRAQQVFEAGDILSNGVDGVGGPGKLAQPALHVPQ